MPKFYATMDSDGFLIRENAHVAAFETRKDAVDYLVAGCGLDDPTIETGQFSDCWIKSHSSRAPTADDLTAWGSPFAADDLNVQSPGEHPGGRAYWITPTPVILVAL